MKYRAEELPGIERIKQRFLSLLEERKGAVAHHALVAWETTDPATMRVELSAAQNILHKIAGSAGSLGYGDLGQSARDCENHVNIHLQDVDIGSTDVPDIIISQIDAFVGMSQDLILACCFEPQTDLSSQ